VPNPRSKTVQSVDRAIALLRAVANSDGPISLAELSQACGIERPTAWRLLWTLETNGLIEKVPPSHYRLTLGQHVLLPQHAVESLVRFAHPVLQELAQRLDVTASLVHVQPLVLQYIDHVDGPSFASPRWDGPISLHGSSPGKAVLAALPDAEWRAMIGDDLPGLTDTTIVDPDEFALEIARVREQGYAVCRGEDVTYSNGASAAVMFRGRPIAAIDLWGPDRRILESRLHDLGHHAAVAAARVADALQPS
jgi:DNA-binding IclR family transcriptional regulator